MPTTNAIMWMIAKIRIDQFLALHGERQIGERTCSTWILAKVSGLVSSEKTLGLDVRSRTSWELLVKADYA